MNHRNPSGRPIGSAYVYYPPKPSSIVPYDTTHLPPYAYFKAAGARGENGLYWWRMALVLDLTQQYRCEVEPAAQALTWKLQSLYKRKAAFPTMIYVTEAVFQHSMAQRLKVLPDDVIQALEDAAVTVPLPQKGTDASSTRGDDTYRPLDATEMN